MTGYTPRHCATAPRQPEPGPLALFFRRVLRGPRRKQAAPAVCPPAGAAAALAGTPVLGDRMLSEVRQEWNARGEHPYPPAPAFTQTAPTFTPSELLTTGEFAVLDERVDKLLAAEADRLRYIRPYVAETALATPELLERVRDGLLNMDAPALEYGQAPVADVLAAEQEGRLAS